MMHPGTVKSFLLYALLLAGIGFNHAAETDLQVIHLRHRPAAEILPLIKPFVERDGGRVTGTGDELIVQGKHADVSRLEKLVRQLDTAPKRLVITVEQTAQPASPARSDDGGDRPADNRHGEAYSSDIGGEDGGETVEDTSAGGHVYTTLSLNNGPPRQIQVLEGRWATIRTTLRVPVLGQFLGLTGSGGSTVNTLNTIKYKTLTSGFAVRATVQGDQVVIDIAPRSERLDYRRGGAIKGRSLQTTVSGKLGEWIDIGGVVRAFHRQDPAWVHSTYRLSQDRRHILVRVDAL